MHDSQQPLISIVISTRNRSALLKRAVHSAARQTYPHIEIIIVDDGSTDDTSQIAEELAEQYPVVRYIRHQYSRGGNAARNTGVLSATGELIAGLDDDDEFTEDRLSLLYAAYTDRWSLVSSRTLQVFPGNRKPSYRVPWAGIRVMRFFNAVGNQVLIRRKTLIAAGLFDESLVRYQDYDMWLRVVLQFGPAYIINDITQVVYYDRVQSAPTNSRKNASGALQFIRKHRCHLSSFSRLWHLQLVRLMQGKSPRGGGLRCSA